MSTPVDHDIKHTETASADAPASAPAAVSRRLLIRGATVALPTILTLNSKTAAAWAVASGTIAAKGIHDGQDALCLIGDTPPEGPAPGQYYLPENPVVVDINPTYEYKYKPVGSSGSVQTTAEALCENGGVDIKYRQLSTNGNFNGPIGNLDRGILVSATAVASFGIVGRLPEDV